MKKKSTVFQLKRGLVIITCLLINMSALAEHGDQTPNDTIARTNPTAPIESLYKQVMISTPEMASLARSVSCPINYSTGTPQISIPLYTIQCGTLTLPISLSYNASGVKVCELSGMVGQGWSLTGIPSISRQIKGHEDNEYTCDFTNTQTKNYEYVKSLLDNNLTNSNDEQPDEYYYHLANKSGMFMYVMEPNTSNLEYSSFPFNDVKIDLDATQQYFILKDNDGTTYKFNGGEDYSTINNTPIEAGWKASCMIAANGVDSIHFGYGQGYTNTTYLRNDAFAVVDFFQTNSMHHWPRYRLYTNYNDIDGGYVPSCEIEEVMKSPIVYKTTGNTRRSYQAYTNGNLYSDNQDDITSLGFFPINNSNSSNPTLITFRGNSITFDYTTSGVFHQLTSIVVKNNLNEIVRKIVLSYKNYPSTERGFLKSVAFVNGTDTLEKYSFEYEHPGDLPKTDNLRIDFWGFFNNDSGNETTLVPKMTLNTVNDYDGASQNYYDGIVNVGASGWFSRAANETYMRYGTLKSITYPTGCRDEFTFEANQTKILYNNGETDFHITQHLLPVVGKTDTYQVGGLRIKQIKTFNNGSYVNYRTFTYNDDGTGVSPILDGPNYFVTEQTKFYYISYMSEQLQPIVTSRYRTISSTPVVPLSFYNGTIVMYSKVTEYNGISESDNSGKTVYTFNVPSYKWYYTDMATLNGNKYQDWQYGLLQSKATFKKNNGIYKQIVKEEYSYGLGCYVGDVVAGEFKLSTIPNFPSAEFSLTSLGFLDYEGQDTNYKVRTNLLSNTKTTIFDDSNHSMVTDEGLWHSIPYCTLVTCKETTLNEETPYIERYQYPYHFGNTEPYHTMTGQNAINYVVSTTNRRGNDSIIVNTPYTAVSKYKPDCYNTNYNNEGLTNRISYLYDSFANKTQAVKDGKEKVAYLYGYNHQYVIAVIENTNYCDVDTALNYTTATIAANAQPSSANWNSINGLRSTHPEWHITTYKWKPLVGITSMTDPAGVETRYTYDGLGRLTSKAQVINGTEKLLEEYEYNYKN